MFSSLTYSFKKYQVNTPCIPRRDITVTESNPYPCHKRHQRRGGLTIKQAPSSLAEHKQWGTGGLAGGGRPLTGRTARVSPVNRGWKSLCKGPGWVRAWLQQKHGNSACVGTQLGKLEDMHKALMLH